MVFFLLLAINLSLLSSANSLLSIARISLRTFACLSLLVFFVLLKSKTPRAPVTGLSDGMVKLKLGLGLNPSE